MVVCDAAAPEEDEYVKPLIVDSSVGEEASTEEEIDEVLLEMLDIVEFIVSAAVIAATTDGSLLAASLDAEEDTAAASAATAPMLEDAEANGYAGTVRVLGNGGTEGTDGKEKLGTAGTAGAEGRATAVAALSSDNTNDTDACDASGGVDDTAGWVSEGRDAIDGTSGVDGTTAAAAAAVGADDSAADSVEAPVAFATGSTWLASVGGVESGCVTVACATTFPAVSNVATTSTFTVKTLVPAWGALRWNLRCELLMAVLLLCPLATKGAFA